MSHNLADLEEFARQFQTDKLELGYLPLYIEYFERQGIRRDDPLILLEIGTNKGSSLRMWTEYFPNAKVYGLDITSRYERPHLLEHVRIKTALADQGNRDSLFQAIQREFHICAPWFSIAGDPRERQFHIIIDDGSHEQGDQQKTLGYLYLWLRPGGLFVIEDLITGENWMDGNTYNKDRIKPTREVLQIFQSTGKFENHVSLYDFEVRHIEQDSSYCEYRDTDGNYKGHRPQIAFIGKKNG